MQIFSSYTKALDEEISYLVGPTIESIVALSSDAKLRSTLAENARTRVVLEFTEEALRQKFFLGGYLNLEKE